MAMLTTQLTTRPVTAAALIAAVTIAGSGIHSVDITPPRLHAEIASVQLLAVAEPAVILTDIVKAAVSLAGAAVWYIGFPITLPVSLIMGAVLSVYVSGISMGQTAPDPLLSGLRFLLAMPALLVQTSLAELGLSLGLVEPPAPPAAATHTRGSRAARLSLPLVRQGQPVVRKDLLRPSFTASPRSPQLLHPERVRPTQGRPHARKEG